MGKRLNRVDSCNHHLRPDQAALVAEDHGLHTVAEPELPEDVPDVRLDRRLLDHECRGDLTVREPTGDQFENVALACGELVQPRLGGGIRRGLCPRPSESRCG